MKRQIYHMLNSSGLYGAERMVLQLIVEQQKRGHQVTLISYGDPGQGDKAIEHEARRLDIPVECWRGRFGHSIWRFLRGLPRDTVAHSHSYKFSVPMAFMRRLGLCRAVGVATEHGLTTHPWFSRMWAYYLLNLIAVRWLDGFAAVSSKVARDMGFKQPLDGQTRQAIANGIAAQPAETDVDPKWAEIADWLSGAPYLLALGRLAPEKGLDLLIEAFARLSPAYPQLRLVLAGEGGLREALMAQCAQLSIADKVLFCGFVAQPQQLLDQATIFTMPSRTEGMPISLLEAMRLGKKIVVSSVGELPVMLGQGECGELVEPESVAQLVDALERCYLADNCKARAAAERFQAHYTAEQMAAAYCAWYIAVAASRGVR